MVEAKNDDKTIYKTIYFHAKKLKFRDNTKKTLGEQLDE